MSWLSKLFGFSHNDSNPVGEANQYLNQIPQLGKSTYQPYIDQGNQAYGALNEQFMSMLKDPAAFREKLMSGYEPSQSYKNQQEEVMKQIQGNAAAGGVAGSDFSNKQIGEMTNKLLGADKENYLNSLLGIQGTGLTGESGFQNQGYGASQSLADLLGGALNQQGGLAFNQAQNRKQQNDQFLQFLMKALGGAAGVASQPLSLFGNKIWG